MLKKLVTVILICAILLICNTNLAVRQPITVKYEGKAVYYKYNQSSLFNGKPSISMGLIFEKYNVNTFEKINTNEIKFSTNEEDVKFKVGSKYIYVNNKIVELENPIVKVNGEIMLPIDFVREVFGGKVNWDEENKVVELYKDNKLVIHFIDVSKGWVTFIDYKDYDILINCGGPDNGQIIANYLKMINTDDIEIMITSQGKSEFTDGMEAIMVNFDVDKYIFTGSVNESKALRESMALMPYNNIITTVKNRDCLIDLGNGVLFNVYAINSYDNDIKSIAAMLEHKNVKILFLEDIKTKAVIRNPDRYSEVDILRIKNQIENTTDNNIFLDITKPEIAIVSSNSVSELNNTIEENEEKLASEDSTNIFNDRDIEVYNTENIGDIVITIDGVGYEIDTIPINGVFIRQIDFVNNSITLHNESYKNHNLSNCIVTDKKGEKVYYIKEGSIIESGYQRIFELVPANEEEQPQSEEQQEWVFRENFISDKGILYDQNWNKLSEK